MATKWGVVSAGKICHDFVTAVQSIPEGGQHEFVAIAARSLASAKEFASNHNIPKAYGSYEELAKDPDVEVVYIGTVASHHFAVGKLMLENGKHVLMEKPFALNLKQAKMLIEIARRENRFLMEEKRNCMLSVWKFWSIQLTSPYLTPLNRHLLQNHEKHPLQSEVSPWQLSHEPLHFLFLCSKLCALLIDTPLYILYLNANFMFKKI